MNKRVKAIQLCPFVVSGSLNNHPKSALKVGVLLLLATLWLPGKIITAENQVINSRFLYPERDLNPHSHYWPKDFKSFVSTIPPSGRPCSWSGKRDSNSRPRPWQGRALPTELLPQTLKNGCKDRKFPVVAQLFGGKVVAFGDSGAFPSVYFSACRRRQYT